MRAATRNRIAEKTLWNIRQSVSFFSFRFVLVLHGEKVKGGIWNYFYRYFSVRLFFFIRRRRAAGEVVATEGFRMFVLPFLYCYLILCDYGTGLQQEIFEARRVLGWKNWMFLSTEQQQERVAYAFFIFGLVCFVFSLRFCRNCIFFYLLRITT